MNFFDTKKFSMRKEIILRFMEAYPSRQTTSAEKTNFLRYLYRESDKVIPITHVELHFLSYNYFLVVIFTPTQ